MPVSGMSVSLNSKINQKMAFRYRLFLSTALFADTDGADAAPGQDIFKVFLHDSKFLSIIPW